MKLHSLSLVMREVEDEEKKERPIVKGRRNGLNCKVVARLRPTGKQGVVHLFIISDDEWMINTMMR